MSIDQSFNYLTWKYSDKPDTSLICYLKIDLSLRKDNLYVGSGLGGDPSQFFFLLTKKIKTKWSNDSNIHVYLDEKNSDELIFELPKSSDESINTDLLSPRKALNSFWDNYTTKIEVTFKQLIDSSFLKNQNSDSIDLYFLIKAVEIAKDIVFCLNHAEKFMSDISNFFVVEYKDIEKQYLIEVGLPLNYFEKFDALELQENKIGYSYEPNYVRSALQKHPIWGTKLKNIGKRESSILDQLLSEQVMQKFDLIGSFPPYVVGYVIRYVISLERIVKFDLDKKITLFSEMTKMFQTLELNDDEKT